MATLYEKIIEKEQGFDIADKTYDMCVYVEFDELNIKYDDFDMVISRICRLLEVSDDLKLDEIANVDITGMFKENETLLRYIRDNFDFNMDENSDEIEYMVCNIFPQLVSGGVPDRIYTELAQEVFGVEINIRSEFKEIAEKFHFKLKENDKSVCICAKTTNNEWIDWIKYDFSNSKVSITGNTDQCNLWFGDTRKDMTPNLILDLVARLNDALRKVNTYVTTKTLIDPEDWQAIADVEDAYKDDRYQIDFNCVEFEDNSYIHFTLYYENREFDGLFRIHDPVNGPDMSVVSIYNCCIKEHMDFANAHWEEIREKLCEYANERLKHMENENREDSEVEEI